MPVLRYICSADSTIFSTERIRSGRLMTVLWQNRHCQGQPRMISIEIRSCTQLAYGRIGASGKTADSKSAMTEGSIVGRASLRVGVRLWKTPPDEYSAR